MSKEMVSVTAGLFDGAICIDIAKLIESLSDDEKQLLAQHLAFSPTLFEGAVDMLINGTCYDGHWWYAGGPEQRLRMKALAAMPKVAQDAIRYLLEENARLQKRYDYYQSWQIWRRHRDMWPDEFRPEPQDPGFGPGDCVKPDELAAHLNSLVAKAEGATEEAEK